MSYASSVALQKAVFGTLTASTTLTDAVEGAVFDHPPSGAVAPLFVTLGPEKVTDKSDVTALGARHDFVVSIVSEKNGFGSAKEVAALVCDLLVNSELNLERGELVALRFVKAVARRVAGGRRIDLSFRARIDNI